MLAPIGSLQDLDAEGGAAVARAAGAFGVPMMLSSVSEPGLEATAAAAETAALHGFRQRFGHDRVAPLPFQRLAERDPRALYGDGS